MQIAVNNPCNSFSYCKELKMTSDGTIHTVNCSLKHNCLTGIAYGTVSKLVFSPIRFINNYWPL